VVVGEEGVVFPRECCVRFSYLVKLFCFALFCFVLFCLLVLFVCL